MNVTHGGVFDFEAREESKRRFIERMSPDNYYPVWTIGCTMYGPDRVTEEGEVVCIIAVRYKAVDEARTEIMKPADDIDENKLERLKNISDGAGTVAMQHVMYEIQKTLERKD